MPQEQHGSRWQSKQGCDHLEQGYGLEVVATRVGRVREQQESASSARFAARVRDGSQCERSARLVLIVLANADCRRPLQAIRKWPLVICKCPGFNCKCPGFHESSSGLAVFNSKNMAVQRRQQTPPQLTQTPDVPCGSPQRLQLRPLNAPQQHRIPRRQPAAPTCPQDTPRHAPVRVGVTRVSQQTCSALAHVQHYRV